MKNPWRFFLLIEALLAILLLWQLASNTAVLVMFIFGVLNIYWALRKNRKRRFQLILGSVILALCLVNSPATWAMLIFGVSFIFLKGAEIAGVNFSSYFSKNKKAIIMVEAVEPTGHHGEKKKQNWMGSERIGNEIFEWDDINLSVFAGDTIIDLGNTLLPKEDNVVLIRKGFGRTRIIVPDGVGIMLEHASIYGKIEFDHEETLLKNESIKIYSEDYDQTPRRLKLVTNTLFGDVEVIRA
ncbi:MULTISPECIES: cell wall-active antibiotics response protein LiaF [Enterococcus]|uniref:Cell wall-active antibiotics response protein n=1 Tax=Enterococcus alishanensis TaxID=1303817 RepID=A0ABS6TAD6_9ENTE|nr:cell wall-active antibiotics response protein [Enterococcus alishanensis]